LCAALSCSCTSSLKPVYVVPDAVAISGDGVNYPNASAKNVVTFSSGLPMMGRDLTLTCADGQTETVHVTNDGLDPLALVSTIFLVALTASNVTSAVRSPTVEDQVYYGALATITGGVGALVFLTSWQPSRPVTVNHPGSVCHSTAPAPTLAPPPPPAVAPPPDAPPPAIDAPPAATDAPPAPLESEPPPAPSDKEPPPVQ
jgi:hypothetical protein